MVAHGSLRVNQDQSNQNGWEEQREKNHKVPLGFQNINMLLKDLEKKETDKVGLVKGLHLIGCEGSVFDVQLTIDCAMHYLTSV